MPIRKTFLGGFLDSYSYQSSNPPPVSLGKYRGVKQLRMDVKYYCCRDYCPCFPARYILSLMGFFGFVIVYALRVNMSVAVVAMTSVPNNGPKAADGSNSSENISWCVPTAPTYDWTNTQQAWVLAAFFYGYILTQLPGGYLATRFSGKHIYGIGVMVTSALTLLTYVAAQAGFEYLVVLRAIEGMFEGVTFPAMHALLGKWAPPLERSKMTTIALGGSFIGNVLSFPITGWLCQCGFAGGWPSVFYVFGASGIIWYVFWLFLVYETPQSHPRISLSELSYIERNLSLQSRDTTKSTPWLKIFTSPAVWGILFAHVSNNWGFYTLLTCMPTYLYDVLDIDIKTNGLYSAIPFAFQALMCFVWGWVTDKFRSCGLPTVVARKMNNALGMLLPGLFLVLGGYFGNTVLLALTFLSLALFFGGMVMAGFNSNHLDIAPKYAGILMGITNTAATVPGILGPYVAKWIAKAPITETVVLRDQWRIVFIIATEIYIAGVILNLVLARGSVQSWAKEDDEITLIQNKVHKTDRGCESPIVPDILNKPPIQNYGAA